jgi:hypothetical protein
MKTDWKKHLRSCAKIPCSFKVQRGHYHWYYGKYNSHLKNERLQERLLWNFITKHPGSFGHWGTDKEGNPTGAVIFNNGKAEAKWQNGHAHLNFNHKEDLD